MKYDPAEFFSAEREIVSPKEDDIISELISIKSEIDGLIEKLIGTQKTC
mgnify:CR=1 FL=1